MACRAMEVSATTGRGPPPPPPMAVRRDGRRRVPAGRPVGVVKVVVPDAGVSIGGTRVLPRTSDAAMPHVWTVLGTAGRPGGRGRRSSGRSGPRCCRGRCSRCGLSLGGLLLGGVLGVLLAVLMQRSGLLERALLPYVVASQTVPLIAIAPLVAGWGGKIAVFGAAVAALGERHGHRRLPGVLPDRGRHAARARRRPAPRTSSCSARSPAAGGRRCCGCGSRRRCRT